MTFFAKHAIIVRYQLSGRRRITKLRKYNYKDYLAHTAPGFLYGMIGGTFIGVIIFFFTFTAEKLMDYSKIIYTAARGNALYIVLLFVGLILFACLMAYMHKKAPEIKGGGIPRSEGILRGTLSFRWLRTFIGTVLGSFISFFCGLPLGSEGPSVLIGTSLGHLTGKLSRNHRAEDRYIMTGGACAGFAVATGSPLTAIIFALEEVHKRFTPMLVIVASSSVLFATCVNRLLCLIFGVNPVLFEIGELSPLQMTDLGFVLLAVLIVAFAVGLFDIAIASFNTLMNKRLSAIPEAVKLIFVFVLTGILGLVAMESLYGGRSIITGILDGNQTLVFLLLMLAIRFFMMIFTSNSGATGGIFIPTLTIGALIGALCSKLFITMGMDASLSSSITLIAMAAFMGGTMRAPLTAAVFFLESTAQFTNLFYVVVAVFLVYFLTEIFNRTSFYDIVLADMEERQNRGKKRQIARFEMKVADGAFVIGKAVRDILWPHSAIVTSITRANRNVQTMDNGGEKKMYAGDTIVVKIQYYDEEEVIRSLSSLVGHEYEIKKLET